MKTSTILVVASCLVAAGCQRQEPAPTTPEPARPTEGVRPMGSAAPAPTPPTETTTTANLTLNQLLGYLHVLHQQQGEVATLGVQKGSTTAVQNFARGMVGGHEANDTRLLTLANNKRILLPGMTAPAPTPDAAKPGTGAAPPPTETAKTDLGAVGPWVDVATHQALLAKLQALSGPAFDEAFLAAVAQSHDAAWNHVREAQAQFTDPDVVSYLGDTMKELQTTRDDAMARRARRGAAL